MPVIPKDEREEYRQWAKEHNHNQMDTMGWVHESDYSAFAKRIKINGEIHNWSFYGEMIHGRMENHTTRGDELNGHICHTSKVLTIVMQDGKRYAGTKSGSTYLLLDD